MARAGSLADGSGLPGWRLKLVFWVAVGCAAVLVGRLFFLQVVQGSWLGAKARDAHQLTREITPSRGRITDRHGVTLAANRNADRLVAAPSMIRESEIDRIALALAPIIRRPAEELRVRLSGDAQWVSLATRLTPEQSAQVRALGIKALGLEPTPIRVYPNGRLAAHALGFTNLEGDGKNGIEGEYDAYLRGKPGRIAAEQDPRGNWLAIANQHLTPPESGADIVTTIDSTVQYYAEQALRRALEEQKAKSGAIVVMRPRTGEVLAMASLPDYEPERYWDVRSAGVFTNPVVSHQYEPGSTMKVITMAAGLAEGVITPETRIDDRGYLRVGDTVIHNWDRQGHPNASITEVLIKSSNVGASYVSTRVGKDAFYRRLRDFGFGRPTGIDLEGEAEGALILPSDPRWAPVNLYTNSYGQGVAVTPIQLLTAQAAVANGGLLMRPYVVSKVIRDGTVIRENRPTVVRRVMPPQMAARLKGMLQAVVEEGSAKLARLPGYTVGGKTGTASVPDGKGGYEPERTIASFVGFTPVDDPEYIALVKLDHPRRSPWGSQVAPPAFRELARRLYAYLNVPPERREEQGAGGE